MADELRRGDIRWYRFSHPDKRRPVLILTRDSALDYLGQATIAPITSTVRGIPSEVPLDESDGMKGRCAINLDHVQTVDRGRIGARITAIDPHRMVEVRRALLFALGF